MTFSVNALGRHLSIKQFGQTVEVSQTIYSGNESLILLSSCSTFPYVSHVSLFFFLLFPVPCLLSLCPTLNLFLAPFSSFLFFSCYSPCSFHFAFVLTVCTFLPLSFSFAVLLSFPFFCLLVLCRLAITLLLKIDTSSNICFGVCLKGTQVTEISGPGNWRLSVEDDHFQSPVFLSSSVEALLAVIVSRLMGFIMLSCVQTGCQSRD